MLPLDAGKCPFSSTFLYVNKTENDLSLAHQKFITSLRYLRFKRSIHGRALEESDPHELAGRFEVCQTKGTPPIGASELTLFKSHEIGLLRIRPLCF